MMVLIGSFYFQVQLATDQRLVGLISRTMASLSELYSVAVAVCQYADFTHDQEIYQSNIAMRSGSYRRFFTSQQ